MADLPASSAAAFGSRNGTIERLLAQLAAKGLTLVDPPVLHPVKSFVDLAGEDFRSRLFTTSEAGGEEMALRSDFTIPVALMHLANAEAPSAPAGYAYCGPVFRQRRRTGAAEFLQAGVEWIGRPADAATDAGIVALAREVAGTLGLEALSLRIGDADLFAGLVERLPLPPVTRTKLARAFGDRARLDRLLAELAAPGANGSRGTLEGLSKALAQLDQADARRIVHAVVDVAAGPPFGGRSADEIADRLMARAAAITDPADGARAAAIIADYLAIACPAAEGPDRLSAFARRHHIALEAEITRLAALVAALGEIGVDTAAARFEAGFGRQLDYYTGFVFEMHAPCATLDEGQVVGGGRYDRLLSMLGAAEPIPGIGFAVWLDRIAATAQPGGGPS